MGVAADATWAPPVVAVAAMSEKTLTWAATIKQNPLTFNRGKYAIYIANAVANKKLKLGVAAACDDASAAAGTMLAEITTPLLLVNGVWITGLSGTYNLDGAGTGMTDITGMVLTITDDTGAVAGCSSAIA